MSEAIDLVFLMPNQAAKPENEEDIFIVDFKELNREESVLQNVFVNEYRQIPTSSIDEQSAGVFQTSAEQLDDRGTVHSIEAVGDLSLLAQASVRSDSSSQNYHYEMTGDGGDLLRLDSENGYLYVRTGEQPDEISGEFTITATGDDGTTIVEEFAVILEDGSLTFAPASPDSDSSLRQNESQEASGENRPDASNQTDEILEESIANNFNNEIQNTADDENVDDAESNVEISAISDTNAGTSTISESAANGDSVGITTNAIDSNSSDKVTYSLSDDANGRFTIDSNTGEVTVADASKLDFENATEHSITVIAESSDGSTSSETFTITLSDDTSESSVSSVTDNNASNGTVSESASNGDSVGITASASDADASDSVTYSLSDDADGRFTFDSDTGEVTVADASKLDFENATEHSITVIAGSSDGSTSSETFTINLADDTSESTVSSISDSDATDSTISEAASNGDSVGITASASDADTSDSVTYSLSDDADGRFTIDSGTGEVAVADASKLDFENATEHSITVVAESSDGSTSSETFTINLNDDTSESSVSSVTDSNASDGTVSESASNGDSVGITAVASDADASDSVTYSLSDDADGRFTIDSDTGEVAVADASKLDFESATEHSITVVAESSDGSTSSETFTINLSDDTSESSVSGVIDSDASSGTVSESASNGDSVGITASASDADASDSVTYSLSDDADGRFTIDSNTGEVTVADASKIDFETDSSHSIEIVATSTDGSTSSETFSIQVGDEVEQITGTNGHDNLSGTSGADVIEGLRGNDQINGGSGDDIIVGGDGRDTLDGGDGSDTYYVGKGDDADTFNDSGTDGGTDRIVATDDDTHITIDKNFSADNGIEVISADGHEGVTVGGDNSHQTLDFSGVQLDGIEAIDGGRGNDNITGTSGDDVIIGGDGRDTLSGGDGNDTFIFREGDDKDAIDGGSGGIDTVQLEGADGGDIDAGWSYNLDEGHIEEVGDNFISFSADASGTITLADGSEISFDNIERVEWQGDPIELPNDYSVSSVTNGDASNSSLSESASNGDSVGITAVASDADVADSVTYSLSDDADGRFTIDSNTGEVTVADASKLDFENATEHSITVVAESSDGSTSSETFTINLSDDTSESAVSSISDNDASNGAVSESASDGDSVGITASASDADGSDSVTYSLSDDADGRFTIDSNTGEVTVADASKLDYENNSEHSITVIAESSDGSTSSETFTINLSDDTSESSVTAVGDSDTSASTVSESASNGDSVGITAAASDTDSSDSVTYSLSDDADGRFSIDTNTGEVTVADASKLDYESESQHNITVVAESSDGSTSSADFNINLQDVNEGGVLAVADASTSEDSSVSLSIDVSNVEPGADATITISGVPDGASLTHGTQIDSETWQLDVADAGEVSFVPNGDDASNISLVVQLEITENGQTTTQSAPLNISVSAVADGPTLTVTDQSGTNIEFSSDFEHTGNNSFVQGDLDGWSAPSGDSIEVWNENDVSGDAASGDKFIDLNYESANYYDDAGQIERVMETDSGTPYSLSFEASPRPGFEKYMDMRVSAVDAETGEVIKTMEVEWDGGSVSELSWNTYSMDFVGTGGDVKLVMEDIGDTHAYGRGAYIDDVQLTSTDAYTSEEQIDLADHLGVGTADNDGSETLSIEIADIPDGFAITVDGEEQQIVDNAIELSAEQLESAQLSAPDGFEGDASLKISVTSTETENGDTATTTDSLDLNFVSNDTSVASEEQAEVSYDNTIEGDSGNNKLYGTDDNDSISGEDGNDKLYGGDGDDQLSGGDGNDHLYGNDGSDSISGGEGNDKVYGGDGNDVLSGGEGNDKLYGGDGNDVFTFGTGDDKDFVDGGSGWTDVVQLEGSDGAAVEAGWTYELDSGNVEAAGDGFIELSDDASGVVNLADGSSLSFENIERIEWT